MIDSGLAKSKTILVTGATGFVGSHVLEALRNKKGIHLIAACRDSSRLLPGVEVEVRQGDLTDSEYVGRVTQGVDVVCHAAAWTSLWAHRKEEQRLFRDPSIALVDSAINAGVERFIWDSSVAAVAPKRDGSPIADHDVGERPGFWPHFDCVVDIEEHMRSQSHLGTKMVVLRFGHFVGERFNLGFLSLLLPRLRTHLVPWVSGGKARQPLVAAQDVASAYELSTHAEGLGAYEQFNICGPSFPTMREIIDFLREEIGVARPHFSVPLSVAYAFAWCMEKINLVLPGDPFLTRGMIFLGEDRHAANDLAKRRLGYEPKVGWQTAMRRQLKDEEHRGHPRARLAGGRHRLGPAS